MAISLITSSAATNGSGSNVGSGSFTYGAAPAVGDLLIACYGYGQGTGDSVTPPAGWSTIGPAQSGTTNLSGYLFWKEAVAADVLLPSYTFTHSTNGHYAVAAAAYTGMDPVAASLLDTSASQLNAAGSSQTGPNVNPVDGQERLVIVSWTIDLTNGTFSAEQLSSVSMTEDAERSGANNPGTALARLIINPTASGNYSPTATASGSGSQVTCCVGVFKGVARIARPIYKRPTRFWTRRIY